MIRSPNQFTVDYTRDVMMALKKQGTLPGIVQIGNEISNGMLWPNGDVPNIREINDIVRNLPNGKGLGTFIWEPTKWGGPALFDAEGNTKPEIDVYSKMVEDYGERRR